MKTKKVRPSTSKLQNYIKKWGKQEVRMGDFLHWLQVSGYALRFVDEIHRWDECSCLKCGKEHRGRGWGWLQATSCCSVCDKQIKRDIPPKTEDEWDVYGR